MPPSDRGTTLPPRDGASSASPPVEHADAGPLERVEPTGLLELESASAFGSRYVRRQLLGKGGMGEVHLCKDRVVGRSVAMKTATRGAAADGTHARFVREARIQGQLEHPSVVPVYDIGIDPAGDVFFTMKRVRGETLATVLDGLRRHDPAFERRYARRRLLTAFSSVSLAVDFAHAHGVIHRDLKPANVMLGDFGEVYVLDWGIALTRDVEARRSDDSGLSLEEVAEGGGTVPGHSPGTPGYMAPELLAGSPADERSDVYALGAILFELLTLEPLHKGDSAKEVLYATLAAAASRPSARAPEREVPPELEAISVKATAREPDLRFATARALSDEIERYLDGDRDLALRREMAKKHAEAAGLAATQALAGDGTAADRTRAIREVSRALALDPEERSAMRALVRLILTPPRELPDGARKGYDHVYGRMRRKATRLGAFAYLSWLLFVPMYAWMGQRETAPIVVCVFLVLATVALQWQNSRSSYLGTRYLVASCVTSTIAITIAGRVVGPLMLTPALLVTNTVAYALIPGKKVRAFCMAMGCLGLVVPFAMEELGVLSPSYAFRDNTIVVLPHLYNLPEAPTLFMLVVSSVSFIAIAGAFVGGIRDMLANAQMRLQLYAWHLQQLVPEEAQGGTE